MDRPKEQDYFEYRGKDRTMSYGSAENYIDALEDYIDHLENKPECQHSYITVTSAVGIYQICKKCKKRRP